MLDIPLIDGLHIKKLDAMDERDLWLASELDKDELISGEDGYLYSINTVLTQGKYLNRKYLLRSDIYQSPYAIYYNSSPIGFMEVSNIYFSNNVEVTYALLKQYRGYGYATKTLREVSRYILLDKLNDIQLIELVIDLENQQSKAVALRAGFKRIDSLEENEFDYKCDTFHKTKTVVLSENKFI